MENIALLRKQDSTIRNVVLVFLGAVIQTLVIFPFYWATLIQGSDLSFPTPSEIIPIYLAISFVYSFLASLSFSQKRVVSPYHTQIATIAIVLIASLFAYLYQSTTVQAFRITLFAILMIPTLLLFGFFGWAMSLVMRRIVGLYGTEEDLVKESFTIRIPYKNVLGIINKEFMVNHGFKLKEEIKNTFVIVYSLNPLIRVVAAFSPNIQNPETECDASYVGYEMKADLLVNNPKVVSKVNAIKRDIEGELHDHFDQMEPYPRAYDSSKNRADRKATKWGLDVTQLQTKRLEVFPRKIVLAILGMAGIGIFTTWYSLGKSDSFSTVVGLWIAIVTTSILILVPTLKDELETRKVKTLSSTPDE